MAYENQVKGKLRENVRGAAVADVTLANADLTYSQNEVDLINDLKAKLNALLAELRTAGVIAP